MLILVGLFFFIQSIFRIPFCDSVLCSCVFYAFHFLLCISTTFSVFVFCFTWELCFVFLCSCTFFSILLFCFCSTMAQSSATPTSPTPNSKGYLLLFCFLYLMGCYVDYFLWDIIIIIIKYDSSFNFLFFLFFSIYVCRWNLCLVSILI